MGRLEGKIAVITGGSSGIGLATAKRFVAEGASVFITGRRKEELDQAVRSLGDRAAGVQGDIASLADLDRLYTKVKADKGRIDILVANAAIGKLAPLGKITEEDLAGVFDVNVKGTLFTVQKALPLMRSGGSIILVGSVAGIKGSPAFSIYNASKAAVRNFARSWALDLKGTGIRINVLSPGPVDTPSFRGLGESLGNAAAVRAGFEAMTAMGRVGEASEIAAAAVFLAADDSSFMTGSELFVDGGTGQI